MGLNRWVMALGVFLGIILFGLQVVVTVSNQVLLPSEPLKIVQVSLSDGGPPWEVELFNQSLRVSPETLVLRIEELGSKYFARGLSSVRELFSGDYRAAR